MKKIGLTVFFISLTISIFFLAVGFFANNFTMGIIGVASLFPAMFVAIMFFKLDRWK